MTSRALFGNADQEVDHEFAAKLMSKDPKTALNQFCQRFCHRPITRDDVVFTVTKYPTGYQATVKLNCIEGQEFAGEVSPSQKEAERHASQQVLDFYNDQINGMRKVIVKKKKKRPALVPPGAPPPVKQIRDDENAGLSHKADLNAHCGKILRRVLEKNEVMYETQQVVGGYQATVRMPGLPGDWGQQIWAGEVSEKKQAAEQSVALVALEAIKASPELMAKYNEPAKEKNWTPGGRGRAMGKGNMPAGNVFGGMAYWRSESSRD